MEEDIKTTIKQIELELKLLNKIGSDLQNTTYMNNYIILGEIKEEIKKLLVRKYLLENDLYLEH